MRRFNKNFYNLLGIIVVFILGGVLILASVSTPISLDKFNSPYYFLFHQFLRGLLPGFILGTLAFFLPLSRFKKYIPHLFWLTLLLVAATFVPMLGLGLKGASRWLKLGPLSFQPSEFLKIVFILYWAYLLSKLSAAKHQEKFIAFWVTTIIVSALLLLQPDMSTLLIILGTSLGMYFLAGASFKKLGLIFLMFLILGAGAIPLAPYRLARLKVFFHPEQAPLGSGYQLRQQLLAVGSGGFFGKGLGFGDQKFGFLPHSMSDSIFAIISEETGFFGALIIIFLFILFTWLAMRVGRQSPDLFSKLLIAGIVIWIDLQAIIHIGANLGLVPVSGIPLPFISYGGSALAAELMAMGFLLNVAKEEKIS